MAVGRRRAAEAVPRPAGQDDVRAVATVVRNLVGAWNRGDADAFGRVFTRSASYVTGSGRVVRGRAAIADLPSRARGKVRIVGEVEVHRRAGVALARFGWRSPGPRGSARAGAIACTLARRGAIWRIRRLINEERRATRPRAKTRKRR